MAATQKLDLSSIFAAEPASHPQRWDDLYKASTHPWDRAGPSLALYDLLLERTDLVPPSQDVDHRGQPLRSTTGAIVKRTALVPGCGLGHDVLLLAALGYDVWALDVSEAGLQLAKKTQSERGGDQLYQTIEGFERGNIHWVQADFFSEDWNRAQGTDGSGTFDLIYDYTFLCALPPSLRPQWAKRMASLLHRDGHLICLEFPSGKPLTEAGPPWGVSPETYESLLAHPGEEVPYTADGHVVELASPKPSDNALHRLSLIKPSRTHSAGTNEDGSVKDFISVWTR